MFTQENSRHSAGFSLIELIVALAVSAIVAPAILMLIPKSFKALETSRAVAGKACDMLEFDSAFARDFASIVAGNGFEGDSSQCAFWTLSPDPQLSFSPVLVQYRLQGSAVSRRETSLDAVREALGTNTLAIAAIISADSSSFPPSSLRMFDAGASSFNYAMDHEIENEWSDPTNAPASIEILFTPQPPYPSRRMFSWRRIL